MNAFNPISRRNFLATTGLAAAGVTATSMLGNPSQAIVSEPASTTSSIDLWAQHPPKTAVELGLMQGFSPPSGKLVDKANWQNGLWNRWSFQHTRQLFCSAPINRGPGLVIPFEQNLQPLGNLPATLPKGGRGAVAQALENIYTDAIVVLHQGKLVYEQYWNRMTIHQPHITFSVTKSFTETIVATPIDQGLLAISENDRSGLVLWMRSSTH